MAALQDPEMEQLSQLLARGHLGNAHEIARLLKAELGNRSREPQSQETHGGLLRKLVGSYRS
ncbi:hypothetical protein Q2941_45855 [Bradyrhizobium sp. UFLA05-153]